MNHITSIALAAARLRTDRRLLLRAAACLIALGGAVQTARAREPPSVDLAAARGPTTARIALTRAQMAQARINVPAGTRAYTIGAPEASRKLLAWYRASDGKLLAALEVVPADKPVTHEGVRVHAGAGTQGRASALLEVGTPHDDAVLLAAHDLTVQGQGTGVATAAVPLLSYRGSTHVVALAPSAEQKLLRAPKFDVKARDAAGTVQTELLALSLTGGAVPIVVTGATTKPRVPVDVFVVNPGSEPRYVEAELKPPLQWQQRAQNDPAAASPLGAAVVAAPQTQTRIGTVISDAPGAFNLTYRDVAVNDVEKGQVTSGPVMSDPNGNAGIVVGSQQPIAEARIDYTYDAPSNLVRQLPVPAATITEQAASGNRHVQRVALAGALAGVATLALIDRAGRKHQAEVTIIPTEESDLRRQDDRVVIAAVETGAPVWVASSAPKKPCNCDKLNAKPKIVLGDPDVMVAGSTGGQNDSVLTVLIDANWLVSIVCRAGDGNCKGTLEMAAKSSGWKIGNKEGTPLPKSEDVYDADPAKLKKKLHEKTYTCLGDCNQESPRETPDQPLTTRYVIQIAHGKLQGKAPDQFGGSGKIGEAVVTGTVVLTLKPTDCAGPETTLTLNVKGKPGKLGIEWPKPKAKDK